MIIEIKLLNKLREIIIGQGLGVTKWNMWFWLILVIEYIIVNMIIFILGINK